MRDLRPRALLATALASAVIGAPCAAVAQEPEAIRVEASGDAGCTDAAGFAGQITARTSLARVVESGASRIFRVRFTRRGPRVRGELVITSARGVTEARDLEGACAEVVSALGLVAALATDPHASTVPSSRPSSPPLRTSGPPETPAPRAFAPLPWWGPIGLPLPAFPAAAEPSSWRVGVGASFGGEGAIGPSLVLAGTAFVDVERAPLDAATFAWLPAFRLGFLGADGGTRSLDSAFAARFRVFAARIDGCPLRVAIVRRFAATPCVRLEAGARLADGVATVSLSATRPWFAPGVTARLGAEPVQWLRIEAEGGAVFPVVRDSFSFQPGGAGFTTPAAGATVGASLSAHFP